MTDNVNHPSHYEWLGEIIGVEPIDIASEFNFCRGNALKYILRAGRKSEAGITDRAKEIEDLQKAAFYIKYEIDRMRNERPNR